MEYSGDYMVKIIIMPHDEMMRQMVADIEARRIQKEDKIIYIESIESARKLITPERLRMLGVIKRGKPASLYMLSKLLGKDFKTVFSDAKMLQQFGLLSFQESISNGRKTLIPRLKSRKLELEVAF